MEIFSLLMIAGLLGLLVRNEFVNKFRRELIQKISDIDQEEIQQGHGYTGWRLNEYGKVTYQQMLFKFWKRLKVENFYKNTSFLDKKVTNTNKHVNKQKKKTQKKATLKLSR